MASLGQRYIDVVDFTPVAAAAAPEPYGNGSVVLDAATGKLWTVLAGVWLLIGPATV